MDKEYIQILLLFLQLYIAFKTFLSIKDRQNDNSDNRQQQNNNQANDNELVEEKNIEKMQEEQIEKEQQEQKEKRYIQISAMPMLNLKATIKLQDLNTQEHSQQLTGGIITNPQYEYPPMTPVFLPSKDKLIGNKRSLEQSGQDVQQRKQSQNKGILRQDFDQSLKIDLQNKSLIATQELLLQRGMSLEEVKMAETPEKKKIFSSFQKNSDCKGLGQSPDSNFQQSRIKKYSFNSSFEYIQIGNVDQRQRNNRDNKNSFHEQNKIFLEKEQVQFKKDELLRNKYWLNGSVSIDQNQEKKMNKRNQGDYLKQNLKKRPSKDTNFMHHLDSDDMDQEQSHLSINSQFYQCFQEFNFMNNRVYEVLKKRKIERINKISLKEASKSKSTNLKKVNENISDNQIISLEIPATKISTLPQSPEKLSNQVENATLKKVLQINQEKDQNQTSSNETKEQNLIQTSPINILQDDYKKQSTSIGQISLPQSTNPSFKQTPQIIISDPLSIAPSTGLFAQNQTVQKKQEVQSDNIIKSSGLFSNINVSSSSQSSLNLLQNIKTQINTGGLFSSQLQTSKIENKLEQPQPLIEQSQLPKQTLDDKGITQKQDQQHFLIPKVLSSSNNSLFKNLSSLNSTVPSNNLISKVESPPKQSNQEKSSSAPQQIQKSSEADNQNTSFKSNEILQIKKDGLNTFPSILSSAPNLKGAFQIQSETPLGTKNDVLQSFPTTLFSATNSKAPLKEQVFSTISQTASSSQSSIPISIFPQRTLFPEISKTRELEAKGAKEEQNTIKKQEILSTQAVQSNTLPMGLFSNLPSILTQKTQIAEVSQQVTIDEKKSKDESNQRKENNEIQYENGQAEKDNTKGNLTGNSALEQTQTKIAQSNELLKSNQSTFQDSLSQSALSTSGKGNLFNQIRTTMESALGSQIIKTPSTGLFSKQEQNKESAFPTLFQHSILPLQGGLFGNDKKINGGVTEQQPPNSSNDNVKKSEGGLFSELGSKQNINTGLFANITSNKSIFNGAEPKIGGSLFNQQKVPAASYLSVISQSTQQS